MSIKAQNFKKNEGIKKKKKEKTGKQIEIDDADVKSGVLMQGFQVQQVITYHTNLAGPDGRFSSSYFSSRVDLFFAPGPPSTPDAQCLRLYGL